MQSAAAAVRKAGDESPAMPANARFAAPATQPLIAAIAIAGAAFATLPGFGRAVFGETIDELVRPMLLMLMSHAVVVLALAVVALRVHSTRMLAALVLLDLAVAGSGVNAIAPRSLFDEPPLARAVRRLAGEGRFTHLSEPFAFLVHVHQRLMNHVGIARILQRAQRRVYRRRHVGRFCHRRRVRRFGGRGGAIRRVRDRAPGAESQYR